MQTFITATDGDFKKATFDTRSEEDKARELGAGLLQALRREGRIDALKKNRKRKVPAMLLLLTMCYEYGRVEEIIGDYVSLVIRKPIKEIAVEIGISARSAYLPVRLLEKAKLIERIEGRGKIPHAYVLCAAVPRTKSEAQSKAESEPETDNYDKNARANSDAAAQHARANSDASLLGYTEQIPNSALFQGLARANSDASLLGYTREFDDPRFYAENSVRRCWRAQGRASDDDDDEYIESSSSSSLEPSGNPDTKAVFEILHKRCRMWANHARHWAARTSLTDAMALEIMMNDQPGLSAPGAWCSARLRGGDITDTARQAAQRKLQRSSHTPQPQTSGGDDDECRIDYLSR